MKMSGYRVLANRASRMSSCIRVNVVLSLRCFRGFSMVRNISFIMKIQASKYLRVTLLLFSATFRRKQKKISYILIYLSYCVDCDLYQPIIHIMVLIQQALFIPTWDFNTGTLEQIHYRCKYYSILLKASQEKEIKRY